MPSLDDIDLEILRLLGEDARRPYSDIAEAVDLSGPAVSDRVQRLREAGIIEGFTVEVDRSQLRGGVPIFVHVEGAGDPDTLANQVGDAEAVEHVLLTASSEIWFTARVQGQGIRQWIADLLPTNERVEYSVRLVDDMQWSPSLGGTAFALTCAECSNTVDSEGETARIEGDVYHFCCPSCRIRFEERYERIEAEA